MRPNVDIPWSIHGEIKEYSQSEGKTIEQAYIDVLREGLDTMPTPVQPESELAELADDFEAFGPRTIPVTNEQARDINDICTFLPRPGTPRQPVTFKSHWRSISKEDLEEALTRIASKIQRGGYDWFTVHQLGGAWVGRGIHNFNHALQTVEARFKEADFDTYKTGFAIYLSEIDDGEFLALRAEIERYDGSISDLQVGFLTDGHPVDGARYKKLAAQFGLSEFQNGRDRDLQEMTVSIKDRYELDVVDTVVRKTSIGHEDEPIVAGIIAKNPIQQNEKIRRQLWSEAPEREREMLDDSMYRPPFRALEAYDHVYISLKNHHSVSEDKDYELNAISALNFTPIFDRQNIWNLSLSADW